jgi:Zn-finger nucleic acid-binding protein/RNA polymerase subunit RPABC4/transcription elongation factor Spt4
MQAGTLHCPNCGAVVANDSTRCQYCNAVLETVACSRCMGMMFVGTKFCPHCGAAATIIEAGEKTAKSCPRCKVAMQEVKIGVETLDQCPHCGGLWAGISTFDRICSDATAQSAATGLSLPPAIPPDPRVQYLQCPQCHSLMGRINYFHHSGIVLNICRPHGMWLERDQIRQVVEFIRSGGVDRARQIETEELNRAKRSLEAERRIPNTGIDYYQT